MNVIIPLAGKGKRFQEAGFTFPKPLIDINGKPMIQLVVENLNFQGKHFFICLEEHYKKYALKDLIHLISKDSEIIVIPETTEGAAVTVLHAKEKINNEDELIIANSDQMMDWNPQHFLSFLRRKNADGGIVTFISTHPKWSFVKCDDDGRITEVAEKRPISNIATAGIYYFKKGEYFVNAAEKMINKNLRVNNEFYVAPTYNEMIKEGKKIFSYSIAEMRGLGTPEDVQKFIQSPAFSKKEYD